MPQSACPTKWNRSWIVMSSELTAAEPGALYPKVRMWVWKEEMVPVKMEFYTSGDTLAKTLT